MSSVTIYNFNLYCLTESAVVNTWDTSAPTACPHNETHTIDPNSIVVVQTVTDQRLNVAEQSSGNFQHSTLQLNVPAGSIGDVSTHDFSWPMDLQLWKTCLYPSSDNVGDQLYVYIAPNTTVGAITEAVDNTTTVLHVTSTAFSFPSLTKGIEVTITDGVNTNDLGRIVSYDIGNSTITIETNPVNNFAAGSYIQFSICMVHDLILQGAYKEEIGSKGLKSMSLPANTIIRIYYTNNTGLAKTVVASVEYYYT
jgi:hypothetical protein